MPASRTRAMFWWSIIARAWRSASKRAMTWRLSMPGLMILSATLRRTGSCCSAMYTTPMPPSPICWSSLYGPMIVPGRSVIAGSSDVLPCSIAGAIGCFMKLPARSIASSRLSTSDRRSALSPQASFK